MDEVETPAFERALVAIASVGISVRDLIPHCWCGEQGWQTVPGEYLCEAGHDFRTRDPAALLPITLDPTLVESSVR